MAMNENGPEMIFGEQQTDTQTALYSQPVNEARLNEAIKTLQEYRDGKKNFDKRVADDEQWWRLRNHQLRERPQFGHQYPSAWLFNSIAGKHAAAMESYPEPNVLPREAGDAEQAKTLSQVIPVVLDMADFKETYSLNQWRKAKCGTAVYGVFWDASKLNGLGDISVRPVEVLNLYTEPGVMDIQMSRNVFHVEAVDIDILRQEYPDKEIKGASKQIVVQEYIHDDTIKSENKALVIDWYYKVKQDGRTVLHYCKFVDNTVLYSTENEGTTLYDDGDYPFVLDILYPIEDSMFGFGYIDVGRHSQEQIDLLNQAMIVNALMNCRPRYFKSNLVNSINKEQFADWAEQIVDVEGPLTDVDVKQIQGTGLDSVYVTLLQNKIAELKETTSNQDVMTGNSGGITAASAIQALQETAGMPNKDMIRGTYRAYERVVKLVIERIRQFYSTERQFRITGADGKPEFINFSNGGIAMEPQTGLYGEDMGMRKPEFDIEVTAQRETAYTKLTNNTTVLDLYQQGIFNPQNVDVALAVMDALDMPRKDKIVAKIQQNATFQQKMAEYAQLAYTLAEKYDPAVAAQLQGQLMQDLGGVPNAPAGKSGESGDAERLQMSSDAKTQDTRERNTRERAEASTTL